MTCQNRVVLGLLAVVGMPWLAAQEPPGGPEVVHEFYHDTSVRVSEYPFIPPQAVVRQAVRPLFRRLESATPEQPDQVVQTALGPLVSAKIGLNFDGIGDAANGGLAGVPPDSNVAVGATQVVEAINTSYQVFDKSTGASVFGPAQISSIFTGVPGLCGQGAASPNFTDPIVLYDKMAGRWLISIVAANSAFTVGNECIAISTSSDAAGSYHRYAFGFSKQIALFNDYPKLGVWPDAYYAAYNIFTTTSFAGALACAYDRSAMLAGTASKAVCFFRSTEFAFLPGDLDGALAPPAGEPDFFLDLAGPTALHLYRFHVDFTTTSNSTFTGPITIPVAAYSQACAATGTCVPQVGTPQRLDSLGDRLMHRLAYRRFAQNESLVVNHSVATSTAASAVRWYEIRNPNGTPVVFQQSTYAGGQFSFWMGSIAMDKAGDIALGFSVSSSTIHPSIVFTGRVPTDPLNTMESLALIFVGQGSQTGGTVNGADRWGDYSAMAIDPTDDCTFWYVNEYLPSNGEFNFHTRLASLKFPGCQ